MKLALLAGGKATRLYPRTLTIAKSMVEVAGEPFIGHQLRLLHAQGIREVVLCVGQFAQQIKDYAGNGERFGVKVEYSVETGPLLGTGGALKQALSLLGEHFWVMYGDSYLPVEFAPIEAYFKRSPLRALMTVYQNHNHFDASNVVFSNGIIKCYDKVNKTSDMDYIDYGLGILSSSCFTNWPDDTPFDLADLYRTLAEQDSLLGYEVHERFYEIGSEAGLHETHHYLMSLA